VIFLGHGNQNGICRGNCFYRSAGNGQGNDIRVKIIEKFIKETAQGQGKNISTIVSTVQCLCQGKTTLFNI